MPRKVIVSFGLSQRQISELQDRLSKHCTVFQAVAIEELVDTSSALLIIAVSALDMAICDLFFERYCELADNDRPAVFWVGYPKPPRCLRSKFQCVENFGILLWHIQRTPQWRKLMELNDGR